jgi:hypothetical protein
MMQPFGRRTDQSQVTDPSRPSSLEAHSLNGTSSGGAPSQDPEVSSEAIQAAKELLKTEV